MNFTPEQLTKAKAAKTAEKLIALAKENGMELTEEEAAKYFAKLHKEGELSDEELDNVSGGTCYSSGVKGPGGVVDYYVITTPGNSCDLYKPGHAHSTWSAPHTCDNCANCFQPMNSLSIYCGVRTESNDPINQ